MNATRNITQKYVVSMIDVGAVNTTLSQVLQFLGGDFELGPVDDSGFGQLTNSCVLPVGLKKWKGASRCVTSFTFVPVGSGSTLL